MGKGITAPLGIVGALEREIASIRKGFSLKKVHRLGEITIFEGSYHNGGIVLVRTGMGPLNAHEGASIAVRLFSLNAMISVGYACALRPEVTIGDLVIGERVSCYEEGGCYESDTNLVKRAMEVADRAAIPFSQGSVVSLPRVVSRKEEKEAVASQVPAIALDMESWSVARVATQACLPFLALRVVSDTVEEDLGIECDQWIAADGTFLFGRGIRHCLTHPFTLIRLNRLRRQTASASAILSLFIHHFVTSLHDDPSSIGQGL